MSVKTVDIKTPDGTMDATLAVPDASGSWPAVLLCMDAFGLRPALDAMAERLSALGCVVLAPNFFYRVRRSPVVDADFPIKPEAMPEAVKQIMPFFQSFNAEKTMADVDRALDTLDGLKQVRSGPRGATGYCMGGAIALRAAARHPRRFAAVASFHGGNLASDKPDSPHLLLPEVKAELYFAHADQDQSMPAEQIERLCRALDQAGLRYESEVYAGAKHGFTMADLPAGDPHAQKRHWAKLSSLFHRTLGTREQAA